MDIRQTCIDALQSAIDASHPQAYLCKDFIRKLTLASDDEIQTNWDLNPADDLLRHAMLTGDQLGEPPAPPQDDQLIP